MKGLFPARNNVVIAGFGHSQVARRSNEALGLTALRTAREAIADAGLEIGDMDGFVSSSLLPSSGPLASLDGTSVVTSNWLSEKLKAGPSFVACYQGHGQLTGSLAMAVHAVASGAANYVLFHRALYSPPSGKYNDSAITEARGDIQYTAPHGFFGALPAMAMVTNEYFEKYGASRDSLAKVVVEARKNGAKLPWSHWYRKPLTIDDYFSEAMICEPLTRLDCDIPVQGVGAFVLTTAERARDLPNKAVFISGYATGNPTRTRVPLHWTLDDMEEAGGALAARLWESCGLGPSEIELPQLYDGFSPFIFIWLEALGFCARGEAHRFVAEGGIDSDLPNSLAVLSGGGVLGNGRLHGLPQMLEVYRQLSGRAGPNQRNVSTGLFSYSLPSLGGAFVCTSEPA